MRNREDSGGHSGGQQCQMACAAFPVLGFLSGIGSGELAVVMIIVLLIFGPKQLPQMARSMAKALRGIRRATDEIKEEIGLDQIIDGGRVKRRDLDFSKPYRPKTSPPPLPPPRPPDEKSDSGPEDETAAQQAAAKAYEDASATDEEPAEATDESSGEPSEEPPGEPSEEPSGEPSEEPDRRDS